VSGTVFANGLEVSARQSDDQCIAAMPDVCLSPPSPPAGPIPIPYPNFSQASDTTDGTKTVKIAGDEIGMKNQSSYKSSKGDEAATKSLGMGINTASLGGKTFFAAWSSDVMFEGANAVRFTDMTTHNHANPATSAGTTAAVGKPAPKPVGDPQCVKLELALREAEQNDTKNGKIQSGEVVATSKHSRRRRIMKSASESFMKGSCKPSARSGYLQRPQREKIKSGERKGKTREPKIACLKGDKDRYNGWTCNSGHAEGKAIQDVFENLSSPGGTLTLRVRWNDDGDIRDDPCPACKSAICKTAAKCNLKIELCVQDGKELKKEPAPCDSDGTWAAKKGSKKVW